MVDLNDLKAQLRVAEAALEKWKASDHPTIIQECQDRVNSLKQAIFRNVGFIEL